MERWQQNRHRSWGVSWRVKACLAAGLVLALAIGGCEATPEKVPTATESPTASASTPTEQPTRKSSKYVGFQPKSRREGGQVVMPITFVDGSSGEIVAPPELGVQEMATAIYTSGGLGRVDRTMDFRYRDGSTFMHEGPLDVYEGADGSPVELWHPIPVFAYECPNLVFRFGPWFVGVRTCQDELSVPEMERWASLLTGEVTDTGFLVLSSTEPLRLQETGGHEGPELLLGKGRSNWIELEPGACDPARLPDEGDIRTMEDGTRVSFSRIGGKNSEIKYNWFATWCEDGLVQVQVSEAYERFAEAAAEGFRMRNITLAP